MELRVRYVVVGFFTLVVALAGIAFALWIQNRGSLHGRQAMVVHFEGPAPGLRVGAPVTFNGVRVGEVTGLTFDPSDPAAVNARIAVDSTTPVTASTSATLEAQGILGATYLSLVGGDSSEPLKQPAQIVAKPVATLSQDARDALGSITKVMNDNATPLHDLITNIQTFSAVLSSNSGRIDSILQGLEHTLAGPDKNAKPPMYDLPAPASVAGFEGAPEAALVVNDPTSVVAYDTQRLLLKSADGQIIPQQAEWPDSIPKLLQKRVIQAFDKLGYVSATGPMDNATADYSLSLDIRAFEIDEGPETQARVSLGAKLSSADGKVLDAKVIERTVPVGSATKVDVEVDAMRKAFAAALSDLLVWYKTSIEAKP